MQQCIEVDVDHGANKIESCIIKHLSNISSQIKQVTLYSDICGGQNKNSHMIAMYMSCIRNHESLEIINHIFLITCHTKLECDRSCFNRKKNTKIKQRFTVCMTGYNLIYWHKKIYLK